MTVTMYNTLTRKKEVFRPLEPGRVRMYVCGPTVYNHIHIGNARPFVFFDVVRRYLQYKGYVVRYVQNFTDVDDKLIRAAREEKTTVFELADRYIAAYFDVTDRLGVKRADVHPRVTEFIPEIIDSVALLVEKGFAYEKEQNVYFRARKMKDYGKLSHQSLDELQAGARVEVSEAKEDPLDFVLWKPAKPGEIAWDSPWGKGRPGWHIECSVMSRALLGDTIDIHAGGSDLMFPHHENEIAQSEALTGKPFARYWLHNGFINLDNEKMSKSLGNVIRVNELLDKFPPLAIRYVLLSSHYRQPLNFSHELVDQAGGALARLENAVANIRHRLNVSRPEKVEEDVQKTLSSLSRQFEKAMDDDFNTPNAIAVVFEAVKEANLFLERPVVYRESAKAFLDWFETYAGDILGLFPPAETEMLDEAIEALIAEREEARKQRNYARADEIRDALNERGIVLEDTPQGVRWRRA